MSEDEKYIDLNTCFGLTALSGNKPLPKARILGSASPSAARTILHSFMVNWRTVSGPDFAASGFLLKSTDSNGIFPDFLPFRILPFQAFFRQNYLILLEFWLWRLTGLNGN